MKNGPQIHNLQEILASGTFCQMHASDAEGVDLLKLQNMGAGIIRFPARSGVDTHTHVGAHVLYVISGTGELEYEEQSHPLEAQHLYGVPSQVKHAIRAHSELVLLVIGDNYRPADSPGRLEGGGSLKNTFTS